MPTIGDVLPRLSKAKVFSVLDAKDGFWKVKVDEERSYLTTFWTPFGRYRWLRMPFGISSAPKMYQRHQCEIIEGLNGVEVVADDILVCGSGDTDAEAVLDHDRNLESLLKRAREVNLKFNKTKLKLRIKAFPYLGNLLTSKGLKPNPAKVEAILKLPKPTDVTAVQRFVGFVNYLSRCLPNLSQKCEPLRRLTDKGATWKWTSKHDHAFQDIKQLVAKAPVLKFYDASEELPI